VEADELYERELRSERDRLLSAYESVDSGAALLKFQVELSAAIESREPAAFRLKSTAAKEHLRLLRLLGDGLAWRLLHSYAIRQLAKNPAPPPALGSQGDGFRQTLDAAGELTADGHLVLISDLTHCLTIGDLVLCDDRERPSIVECGGHEQFLHKGRKARQFQRAHAVTNLLKDGTATFPGDNWKTRTIELKTQPSDTWDVVDRVVLAAEREGSAGELASRDDFVFAVRADEEPILRENTDHMVEPVVATYTRVLERPNPRVPPCVAWDISMGAKRLLYQGDVFVVHVVDVAAFVGQRADDAEIVKVLRSGNAVTGFGAVARGERLAFSPEFLTDVLLGFATIASTAEAMLEAAMRTMDVGGEFWDPDSSSDQGIDWLTELAGEDGFVDPVLAWAELNRRRPDGEHEPFTASKELRPTGRRLEGSQRGEKCRAPEDSSAPGPGR
jgi:hypothetical protein